MFEHTARKPAGHIIIVQASGPAIEADTHQCKHCGGHFVVQKGSGIRRGYCMRCRGVTCGAEPCETQCIPEEVLIYGGR